MVSLFVCHTAVQGCFTIWGHDGNCFGYGTWPRPSWGQPDIPCGNSQSSGSSLPGQFRTKCGNPLSGTLVQLCRKSDIWYLRLVTSSLLPHTQALSDGTVGEGHGYHVCHICINHINWMAEDTSSVEENCTGSSTNITRTPKKKKKKKKAKKWTVLVGLKSTCAQTMKTVLTWL